MSFTTQFIVTVTTCEQPSEQQLKEARQDIRDSLQDINDCEGIGGSEGIYADEIHVTILPI